jgi:cell division protein FtsL
MKKTITLVILGVFAVIVTAATAHVSLRYKVIRAGYDLGERLDELRVLEEQNRQLRLELSLLRSPERIERLAREKLGLVHPEPGHIRVVRVDSELAKK